MDGMETEGTIVAGSRADLGRVSVGLAVKKDAPHPDISTPAKLAAALKAGGAKRFCAAHAVLHLFFGCHVEEAAQLFV